MKNLILLGLVCSIFACGGSPAGEEVEAKDAVETGAAAAGVSMLVNTEASVINWVGANFTGGQHTGTIKITKGELSAQEGKLVGGSFVIDMNTMENTDLPDEEKPKLVGHLSAGDFFEVEKYPTATFDITSVTPVEGNAEITHNITGNLTMKAITKSITIPAKVSIGAEGVSAQTPQFTIDRTQWGIQYGSTTTGVLKDKAIDDKIGLSIVLSAK